MQIEMEFEHKEELLDAIGETEKPLLIGELSTYHNEKNLLKKTVKLYFLDMYDGQPIIMTWMEDVGMEYMMTEEIAQKLDETNKQGMIEKMENLEKMTKAKKEELRGELTDMGYKTVYGVYKEYEL